jgi:hypothetical protein
MIFLDLEFEEEPPARKARDSAQKAALSGELRLYPKGSKWRLDMSLEENPPADLIRRWGAEIVYEEGLDGRTYAALFGHTRPVEVDRQVDEVDVRKAVKRKRGKHD